MENFKMELGVMYCILHPFKAAKIQRIHDVQEELLSLKKETIDDCRLHMANYRGHILRSFLPYDLGELLKLSGEALSNEMVKLEALLSNVKMELSKMVTVMEAVVLSESPEVGALISEAKERGIKVYEYGTILVLHYRHLLPWSESEDVEVSRRVNDLKRFLDQYDLEEADVQAQKQAPDYEKRVRMYYTMMSAL